MSKAHIINKFDLTDKIKRILYQKSYGVEYQPFISTKDDSVFAYEALARFTYANEPLSPEVFFNICHDDINLFFLAEKILKKFQFENRPLGKKLFVNFDPHILLKRESINEVFDFFSKQENFIIELVENSHEVVNTSKLLDIFKTLDYDFAVDDFFKENSMVSLFLLNKCDYLKFDKDILKQMKIEKSFIHVVRGLIKYAHELNKKVVLEGVEEESDFALAKSLDIDYVQGFLFRSQFIKEMNKSILLRQVNKSL